MLKYRVVNLENKKASYWCNTQTKAEEVYRKWQQFTKSLALEAKWFNKK